MRFVRSLFVLVGLCGIALAQSPEIAREFQAGVDAFRLGKLDEARQRLEKAKAMDPKLPGPYRFLAAVAHAQGRWPDCIAAARQALALNPQSAELGGTRKLHDDCRSAAGRPAFQGELGEGAAIGVTTNVPGATVEVDELTYGGTPMAPRSISPGAHAIEIEKTGWKSVRLEIDALPGIVTDVIVELEPDPAVIDPVELPIEKTAPSKDGWLVLPDGTTGEVAIDGAVQAPTREHRYVVAPGDHVVEIRQPGRDPWQRRVKIQANQRTYLRPIYVETAARERKQRTGMVLVGSGGAIAAIGFASFILSGRASAEAREIDRVERARRPNVAIDESIEPLRTRADFEDARSRAKRWALISNIAYGAALATAGVGAWFLYRGGTASEVARPVAPAVVIVPTTGGAMVSTEVVW